jgi:hypothetical protein
MRLSEVIELIDARIDATRRHCVQKRLPEMGASTVYQGDGCQLLPTQAITETSHEFQTRRTATYDDDVVQRVCGMSGTMDSQSLNQNSLLLT